MMFQLRYQPTLAIDMHTTLCFLGHYQYLHSMKEENKQIKYAMKTIWKIFNVTNMHLTKFLIGQTAKTNLIRISEFYNPNRNCWDWNYPLCIKTNL